MAIIQNGLFIGKPVLGSTAGAPLIADANGLLASGIAATTFVSATTNITVATSAAYATMTGMSISPALAGTYQVHGRIGSAAHTTNNAQILIAIHVAGVIVSDSIAMSIPFIQGGVTPSLAVPMTMYTGTEVTITAGQAITLAWRTSAGTAQSNLSRSLMVTRVR